MGMNLPANCARDNWRNIIDEDATAAELYLVHRIMGGKPDWMDDENWRINMRGVAKHIREHVDYVRSHTYETDRTLQNLKRS